MFDKMVVITSSFDAQFKMEKAKNKMEFSQAGVRKTAATIVAELQVCKAETGNF